MQPEKPNQEQFFRSIRPAYKEKWGEEVVLALKKAETSFSAFPINVGRFLRMAMVRNFKTRSPSRYLEKNIYKMIGGGDFFAVRTMQSTLRLNQNCLVSARHYSTRSGAALEIDNLYLGNLYAAFLLGEQFNLTKRTLIHPGVGSAGYGSSSRIEEHTHSAQVVNIDFSTEPGDRPYKPKFSL